MQSDTKLASLFAVLDCFPDAVALCVDRNEPRFFRVNTVYANLVGVAPADLQGQRLVDSDFFLYRTQLRAMLLIMAHGIPLHDLAVEFCAKDGHRTPTSLSAREVEIDGEPYFIFVHRDSTERKYAEERLAESELRWRMAIEGLGDALWDWSVEADSVFRSPKLLALLKLPAEMARVSFDEHLESFDLLARSRFADKLRNLAQGKCEEIVGQIGLVSDKEEGETVWLGYRCCAIDHAPDRSARRILGVMRDVTELKRQQDALEQQNQHIAHAGRLLALGEMMSAIGHEINQPLAAISSYSGMLLRKLTQQGDEELACTARKIEDQAIRAGEILWQMRKVARPSTEGVRLQPLRALIEEMLDWLQFDGNSAGCRVLIRISQDLPPVWVDRIQIQQVLSNLIRNAAKAIMVAKIAPRLRTILVTARVAENGWLWVQVANRGAELPERLKQNRFDAFFTTYEDGLGLGLSICNTILQRHGGKLLVRERRGGGAVFSFSLPRPSGG
ncbi:Two-component sensory protein [gamma proteobacterium HdN1]|nr:Two-component sensory protein [gamma proteobacterium HdN1]